MQPLSNITLKTAATTREFADAENLFRQYASSLEIDLSFQDFETELETINVQYNQPTGALILAYNDEQAVGCTGIRKLDDDTAELKRMFVQPHFRGHGVAKKMLDKAIGIAGKLGYKRVRLDTIPGMTEAQKLYFSNGFYEIAPYRYNPVEGALFMEKKLGD